MKTKSFRNLFFLFISLLVLILVMTFNYLVDPYRVLKNKFYMKLFNISDKYSHIMLKAYKDIPCDTVVIGGSCLVPVFRDDEFFRYFFNQIIKDIFDYKEQYHLLKDYLSLHPETKNVFIFLSYPMFLNEDTTISDSKLTGNNFNINEWIFLLLSKETTQKSFEIFKQNKKINLRNYNNHNFLLNENYTSNFLYYPDYNFCYPMDIKPLQTIKNIQIFYLIDMIDLLKEKNINYKIIIPPYHAIYSSIIYEIPYFQETIDEIKRISVEISENDVYDFSVINQYTTQSYNNKNYLYCDFVHPNQIFGFKIFRVLHDNYSEKNLYVKLNKKNIEQQIKQSHNQVADYINKNEKLISKYMQFSNDITFLSNYKVISFENAPDYVKKEIDWYIQKVKKINNMIKQGKKIKQGVWNNEV